MDFCFFFVFGILNARKSLIYKLIYAKCILQIWKQRERKSNAKLFLFRDYNVVWYSLCCGIFINLRYTHDILVWARIVYYFFLLMTTLDKFGNCLCVISLLLVRFFQQFEFRFLDTIIITFEINILKVFCNLLLWKFIIVAIAEFKFYWKFIVYSIDCDVTSTVLRMKLVTVVFKF